MIEPIGPCANEEALESYAMGTLPAHAAAPLEEHLLVCERCRERLEETELYLGAVRKVAPRLRLEQQQEKGIAGISRVLKALQGWVGSWPLRAPAWAAVPALAAMIAVGAGLLVQIDRRDSLLPATVELESYRGGTGDPVEAPAGKPIRLRIRADEDAATGTSRVEVVDTIGRRMWAGTARKEGAFLEADTEAPLPGGLYFVRLYGGSGELLREFSLRVGELR